MISNNHFHTGQILVDKHIESPFFYKIVAVVHHGKKSTDYILSVCRENNEREIFRLTVNEHIIKLLYKEK